MASEHFDALIKFTLPKIYSHRKNGIVTRNCYDFPHEIFWFD